MTAPTPAELADQIEHLAGLRNNCAADEMEVRWADQCSGRVLHEHRALIVRALRALGKPDEAAVERAAEAAHAACLAHVGLANAWAATDNSVKALWRDIARAALRSRAADE